MKKTYLILMVVAAGVVVVSACNSSTRKTKLLGKWHSQDKKTKLKITAKDFVLDEGEPIAENYFIKNDSIFTSYEGSEPYTKFVVKSLTDKNMTLIYPDSTSVQFFR
ncbi:MAG: hypothetical protein ACRYFA_01535 [Janthinobacterium lividum]